MMVGWITYTQYGVLKNHKYVVLFCVLNSGRIGVDVEEYYLKYFVLDDVWFGIPYVFSIG